ncbi:MAG: hypothetical protein AB2A00_13935 [Myxococcota bacterium]
MSALPQAEANDLPPPPEPPAATRPSTSSRWARARPHLVALFVSFHLLSTVYYVLPYPPYFDDRTLALPEVKEEMGRFFGTLHKVFPVRATADELQKDLLDLVRFWMRIYFAGRKVFEPYMEAAGITQTWNMFGGTPPRLPRIMVIEVLPRGEKDFVPVMDLRWGTPDSDAMDFRHRKTHEILGLVGWDRQREQYAEYWARRWNAQHPDRPAHKVRLSYTQYRTPPIHEVKDGVMDRKPKHGVATFVRDIAP